MEDLATWEVLTCFHFYVHCIYFNWCNYFGIYVLLTAQLDQTHLNYIHTHTKETPYERWAENRIKKSCVIFLNLTKLFIFLSFLLNSLKVSSTSWVVVLFVVTMLLYIDVRGILCEHAVSSISITHVHTCNKREAWGERERNRLPRKIHTSLVI